MFAKKRLIWVLLAVFLLTDAALFLSVLVAPPASSNANYLVTAQYLEQNPALKPGFIGEYSKQVEVALGFNFERYMSISINEEPFVRQGVSVDKISRQIMEDHHVLIDGSPVVTASFDGQVAFCDSLDSKICWGGPIEIYFDLGGLSAGLHLATITIPDFHGGEHTYSWAFRYDPNAPTLDPNILPTPMILPTETPALTPIP
ncbi:MAG: hypothetical protein ABI690_26555 [Chloroflexota bacterium]